MKTFCRSLAWVLAAVCLAQPLHAEAAADDFVAVAGWPNGPKYREHGGKRAVALLESHGIRAVTTESAGVMLHVPAHQAAEARKLLAGAILKEHLKIYLFDEQGRMLDPDKLLTPPKE